MNTGFTAVLLAAGKNTRFWPLSNKKHKCMYNLVGKPVLYFTLLGLKKNNINNIIIVVSPNDNSIKDYFGNGEQLGLNIEYSIQQDALGMGNAILSAKNYIKTDNFFVLNADQSNVDELIPQMINLKKQNNNLVLASQETKTPWLYGILKIENNIVKNIIEKPKQGYEPSNLMVIGIYLLPKDFLGILEKEQTAEYNYEEVIQKYIDTKGKVGFVKFENLPEITLKFPWDLFRMNKYLFDKYITKSNISKNAKIHKTAIIEGNVVIEDNVSVFEYAVIKGPVYISEGAIIGNHSLTRDYTYIGKKSIVGFGTEVKHSLMFDRVETHKNYIGDSIVDDNCGFGAGSITANRRLDRGNIISYIKGEKVDTQSSFFGNVFGCNVHSGILAGFMPGIKIGNNCNIGASTFVFKDLPDNSICFCKDNNIIKLL